MFKQLLAIALTLTLLAAPISTALAQDETPEPIDLKPAAAPKPTPEFPVANPAAGGGEDAPPAKDFDPPPTLDELVEEYPDLAPYLEEIEGVEVDDMDIDVLYEHIVTIYLDEGMSGVSTFLGDSGIMKKLGIPFSYLDFLTEYEEGGFEAVTAKARELGVINDDDEVVGYLALDSRENLDAATEALEALAVNVHGYLRATKEIEIGIPLDVLTQFQTPSGLLEYLIAIAQTEHVTGFRPPLPQKPDTFDPSHLASEGGAYIGADVWNAAGLTGAGVRVGILDMGFGGIVDRVQEGALPENIYVNLDGAELNAQPSDHGTACAMVVHGIAPEAELYIAYFEGSSTQSFIDAVDFLYQNEVHIINYSVGSPVGPRDGTWGDAPIVDAYVNETGALWVNSAGNYGISHTRFDYNEGEDGWHHFEDGTAWIPFRAFVPETPIIVNWDGSWEGGEENGYKILIEDANDNEVAVAAEPREGRDNDLPIQATTFTPTEPGEWYYLAITRTSGDGNNTFDIFVGDSLLADWAIIPPGSVATPGDAAGAFTVGATALTADELEPYSSQGLTTDGRIKPDIAAPTGESIPGHPDGFIGTSGAAPLVAGTAALVMQLVPEATAPEIKAFLMNTAVDLGEGGEDPVFGAGRIQLPPLEALTEDSSGDRPASDKPGDEGPAGDQPIGDKPGDGPEGGKPSLGAPNPPPQGQDEPVVVTDYNIWFDAQIEGQPVVKAALSFDVWEMQGRTILAGILFYDQAGSPLTSADPNFQIGDGIGAAAAFEIVNPSESFQDVVLFIPIAAFGNVPIGTTLEYTAVLLDATDPDNIQPLWASEPDTVTVE